MSQMEGTGTVTAVEDGAAGLRDAFRAVVEQHSRAVFRLAYRMTGNESDAEEVVQETFLRAYRAFDRFEERSQAGTWLHRIAVNCSLDLLRARQRRAEQQFPQEQSEGRDALQELPSAAPTPERLLLSAEMKRKFQAAMARLTATERGAFALRHYEGKSIEEIAQALEISVPAAKNTVFRAVQKLRQALGPFAGRVT
jgi:RNA polymerase sigma-70 factor, ECF subfamily